MVHFSQYNFPFKNVGLKGKNILFKMKQQSWNVPQVISKSSELMPQHGIFKKDSIPTPQLTKLTKTINIIVTTFIKGIFYLKEVK